jgi:hypothetical protein
MAYAVAGMIDAYEIGEITAPGNPELREYRSRVDVALEELAGELTALSDPAMAAAPSAKTS